VSATIDAPLVEAVFEVRWGTPVSSNQGIPEFKFDEEDSTLFAGLFRAAAKADFPIYRKINELVPPNFPYVVKHQFWSANNGWPCLQIGLGILTVNQVNNGYIWKSFKSTCLKALEYLDKAHHLQLAGIPGIGVELRYQDAFPLKDGEGDSDFVSKRAQITVVTPDAFLKSPSLQPVVSDHHIMFAVPVVIPKGVLLNQLDRGQVGGKAAFIQTTTVRSADALRPDFNLASLATWLEQAHAVQKHAYETLIKPTHERSS